jgi:hypothetical protein
VDGPVDASAAQQGGVGRIDDRIHAQVGDVGEFRSDSGGHDALYQGIDAARPGSPE